MTKTFQLTGKELELAEQFIAECYEREEEAQRNDPSFVNPVGDHYPYHGAIGGAVSYTFTPTGIGVSVVVSFTGTHVDDEVNVTDYSLW